MQSLQLTISEENLELHFFDHLLLSWTFANTIQDFSKMIFHINIIVHDTVVGVSNQ